METIILETGRFLSNIFDPDAKNAKMTHGYTYEAHISGQRAMDREWDYHMKWVNENMRCPPLATDFYTQAQLISMGMIGIYAKNKKVKLDSGEIVDYDMCEDVGVSTDLKHYTLIGEGHIHSIDGIKQPWFPQTTPKRNFYLWKD